jgi:16S rRNA C967 or C1407 C5-methylase (RsmB/RsmF family)
MSTERCLNIAQIGRCSRRLFVEQEKRDLFETALLDGVSALDSVVWMSERPAVNPFSPRPACSWQPSFVDALQSGSRPGLHELHAAGAYYVLDLSSVFQASVLSSMRSAPKYVLDMCAAPGGKSIFAFRMLEPHNLVCNDSVRKRIPSLLSNLKRCKVPATISGEDPKRLSLIWPNVFDLVIVDAPCSGQSLVARGEDNPGCFHPLTVRRNAGRQKRILGFSASTVCHGGCLAYMTCTYSSEENEEVVEWFLSRFSDFEVVAVPLLERYQSHLIDIPCYRLFPFQGSGAGGFCCIFRRRGGRLSSGFDKSKLRLLDVASRS